ncbi:ketopantoate hydroxymethyltransferase [Gaertneriomyces semiglobifer]|nr:ketopantoate hydroxymethyltransferase [Gaertneriomyces semiglobifer]
MTAHDYPSGTYCDLAEMEICLVGDSLAMVALGYNSTNAVTFDEMLHHCRAVARGCKTSFLVGDMPFGTYETSPEQAVTNAVRMVREGRMEAVKLEGGVEMAPTVAKITSVGIPVLGHIGLTPQRASSLGGFKAQGKTLEKAKSMLMDALALQKAGCFAIVLEAVPEAVATYITEQLSIPTIGIGAGPGCSGQVLVALDTLGVYDRHVPKFCKIYANVGQVSVDGLKAFASEVKSGVFPEPGTHTYKMGAGEEQKFLEWVKTQEGASKPKH